MIHCAGEAASRSGDPGADRADGNRHRFSNFAVAVTFGVHQNGAPLLVGEGVQSRLHSACALRELELVLRSGGFVGNRFQQRGIVGARTGAPLSAPRIQTHVARDAEGPRAERDGRASSLAALEDAPKYLRDAIIDLCRVGAESEDVARDRDNGGAQGRKRTPRLGVIGRELLGRSR